MNLENCTILKYIYIGGTKRYIFACAGKYEENPSDTVKFWDRSGTLRIAQNLENFIIHLARVVMTAKKSLPYL